jgi:hypothetical protein
VGREGLKFDTTSFRGLEFYVSQAKPAKPRLLRGGQQVHRALLPRLTRELRVGVNRTVDGSVLRVRSAVLDNELG